jgi:hypothetical protein
MYLYDSASGKCLVRSFQRHRSKPPRRKRSRSRPRWHGGRAESCPARPRQGEDGLGRRPEVPSGHALAVQFSGPLHTESPKPFKPRRGSEAGLRLGGWFVWEPTRPEASQLRDFFVSVPLGWFTTIDSKFASSLRVVVVAGGRSENERPPGRPRTGCWWRIPRMRNTSDGLVDHGQFVRVSNEIINL